MWALIENNEVKKVFRRPEGFKSNGLTYGADIFSKWSALELVEIGIYDLLDSRPDDRFYDSSEDGYVISDKVEKSYIQSEKNLDALKAKWVEQVKIRAKDILSNTDWMVLRFVETATPIPAAVQTRRNNIRQRSTALIKAINDCTTLAEFKALFEGANPTIEDWPEG